MTPNELFLVVSDALHLDAKKLRRLSVTWEIAMPLNVETRMEYLDLEPPATSQEANHV
jgi:hypothetical protein